MQPLLCIYVEGDICGCLRNKSTLDSCYVDQGTRLSVRPSYIPTCAHTCLPLYYSAETVCGCLSNGCTLSFLLLRTTEDCSNPPLHTLSTSVCLLHHIQDWTLNCLGLLLQHVRGGRTGYRVATFKYLFSACTK